MLTALPSSRRLIAIPSVFDANRELDKLSREQQRLLPQSAPEVPGYQLSLIYRPVYCATGDYHDFFMTAPTGPAAFVGDGSGHGPAACILMATMRTLLHTLESLHGDPGATLTTVGRKFCSLVRPDLFMTGVHLVLQEHGLVRWASAGQDPPLHVGAFGQITPVDLGPVGLPLGIERDEVYSTVTWRMMQGERLLVYTDGLVEARNHDSEAFGRSRLRTCWSRLTHLPLDKAISTLLAQVTAHQDGAAFDDDFTILGIERSDAHDHST